MTDRNCWRLPTGSTPYTFKTRKGVIDHMNMGCTAPFGAHALPGTTSKQSAKKASQPSAAVKPSREEDRQFRGPTTSKGRKSRDAKAAEHSGMPCGPAHPGMNHAAFLNTYGSQPLSEVAEINHYASQPSVEDHECEVSRADFNKLTGMIAVHVTSTQTRLDELETLILEGMMATTA